MHKSKAEQRLEFAEMVKLAKAENCKKCFGRGYVGFDINLQVYVPCDCLINAERNIIAKRTKERMLEYAKN